MRRVLAVGLLLVTAGLAQGDVYRTTAIVPGSVSASNANTLSGVNTYGSIVGGASTLALGETAGCVTFEGATANTIENRLCTTDPTVGDGTFNLPNRAGAGSSTLATLDLAQTFSGITLNSARNTFGTAADAANAVDLLETAGCVTFEGSSADGNEARLCATNPTVGDGVFNLPDSAAGATRTLMTLEQAQTVTGLLTQTSSVVTQDVQGVTTKSLTDNTIATFLRLSCASGGETGAVIDYTVKANDASNRQIETGQLQVACVNPSGTETCATPTEIGTVLQALSSGTLTTTWAADTATPTNGCDLRITADSSLTTTGVSISYRVRVNSGVGVTVTPQ